MGCENENMYVIQAKVMAHNTDYQIKQIMKYNRDGPPNRQQARHKSLTQMIRHLQDKRGYGKRWDVRTLGKKTVSRLVCDWREQGLNHRTIANRMVHIRWLASKVNRLDQIPSNKDVGIGLRKNAPGHGTSKAIKPDWELINRLPERERLITELRVMFGLRAEEAMKFQHAYATVSDTHIRLKKGWCKGGRPREVQIVRAGQRELLTRVGAFQKSNHDKSMIPHDQKFKKYYPAFNKIRRPLGVHGHEYRHQWAQDKFTEISKGIKPPMAGGPKYSSLDGKGKARWDKAAERVNQELGHGKNRQDITATYIGTRE